MCGIAGIMTRDGTPPDPAALCKLVEALRHRGPDGDGQYIASNVGLVQTRLAIIDLETGDQPLSDPGGAVLVANAEIYNYIELREELANAPFQTQSDCETPLHLSRQDGADYPARLRGMYAIALHDPADGALLLSRDPFGIKPLYYAETAQGFAFASEVQALAAAGLVEPRTEPDGRAALLQLQFTTGGDTIYAGVHRVLPGETLVVRDGRLVERRRIASLPDGPPHAWSEDEAMARLDAALTDSVTVHQRSDVPYGMFLSGGIDSSALLSLMAQLNERPVRAYTCGFSGTRVPDERDHARAVAAALGADPVEVEFAEQDFWDLLPAVTAAMDQPTADYAVLPTYKLAAQVRADSLKVILSGEGGDEMFGGYGRYRAAMRPWWRGGRRVRPRGIFDGLDVLRADVAGWRDGITAAEATAATPGRTRLQVAQAIDVADWLPNDLLTKLDRCLMAHSVEGRTPFLDPVVVETAYRLPDGLKVRRSLGKWLLRAWLDRRLPVAQAFSRKRGFSVPVGEWIVGRGRELGPLVAAQPAIAEVCDPAAARRLFTRGGKRTGFAAWTLLYYALWHRRHIERHAPAGDVFETLEA